MSRKILVAELVVLVIMLCVWGYRVLSQSTAVAEDASVAATEPSDESPAAAATTDDASAPIADETQPSPMTPPTQASQPAATQTAATNRTTRTNDILWDGPLPELRNPSILIEKSKQRLTVFDGSQIVKQYAASTGKNAGDKQREGDYRTPEGEFYVCVKNDKSKYTRALGLSYPDIPDAERGLRSGQITQQVHDQIVDAIRNHRQPPWKTPLGGEIMIHGDRRGGRTTQGCIALEDRDILELFPKIPVGTLVIIQP